MDSSIFLLLAQDALTNGAIYILLAMATILIFGVTRITFLPQGEFVSYGALTLATLQMGKVPGTVWLVLVLGVVAAIMEAFRLQRAGLSREIPVAVVKTLIPPLVVSGIGYVCAPLNLNLGLQVLLTIMIVTMLGPLVYRVAFRPIADASILNLLIAAVAVHFALVGLGLLFFGAEGVRTPAFSEAQINLGVLTITGQSIWIYVTSIAFIGLLAYFFGRTMYGKALRAVAFNRNGARLVGISPSLAGTLAFALAALIGCLSGILIGPITTIYYDSGFLIGLKGFVSAIVGGMASYPLAAGGALLVGFSESFSSFWLSAYKDVVVFTMIIPVLLWLSLRSVHFEEEE
ncbi:branched-chain amino acid ABC transporter permease [Geobacter sp. AOG1]|uniref:branched-chain amino acid ABC transporter permease n=1 Tax=Geobacter sp. AOG1 TaxID=1566346 RepID=UPI001CC61557|nr:branched-chain amino acid ABC transporter permease [Geobacter sp. AOG1]GFE57386.1 branched-chain amino acid ABC transporter permease [Geobacter sp. AOG1]